MRVSTFIPFAILPHTHEAKSGVKQLAHSVCLSIYRCQSMIEELLDFNSTNN